MNEEIDIIELLKRIKEGKAPKEIEINGNIYNYENWNGTNIQYMYENNNYNMFVENIGFDTKIKILDKPIIEELKTSEGYTELSGFPYTIYPSKDEIIDKINEIARHINKGGKINE